MNKDKFEGSWKEFKGKIKEKWGKLTDNDITRIDGKYDQFLGMLQKRYGYEKDRAEKEFNNWDWRSQRSLKNHEDREMRHPFDRNEGNTFSQEKENPRVKSEESKNKETRTKYKRDDQDWNKKRKAG